MWPGQTQAQACRCGRTSLTEILCSFSKSNKKNGSTLKTHVKISSLSPKTTLPSRVCTPQMKILGPPLHMAASNNIIIYFYSLGLIN